eukprot:UC1_evm1s846
MRARCLSSCSTAAVTADMRRRMMFAVFAFILLAGSGARASSLGWQEVELTADWVNIKPSSTWQRPQYVKEGTRVYLRGLLSKGENVPMGSTTVTTLPSDYAPPRLVTLCSDSHVNVKHRINVHPDGRVVLANVGESAVKTNYGSLDGLSWDTVDTDWISLDLKTGTGGGTTAGPTDDGQARDAPAYKVSGHTVFLRGTIRLPKDTANTARFVLAKVPAQYAPVTGGALPTIAFDGPLSRTDVQPSGEIVSQYRDLANGRGETVCLDGIRYSFASNGWTLITPGSGAGFGIYPSSWTKGSWRIEGNRVYMRGLVSRGQRWRTGNIVGVLPESLWPKKALSFPCIAHMQQAGSVAHRCDIRTNGQVAIGHAAPRNSVYVDLSSIDFETAAATAEGVWTPLPLSTGIGALTGAAADAPNPPAYKREGQFVYLRGTAQLLEGAWTKEVCKGCNLVGTLPEAFRPAVSAAYVTTALRDTLAHRVDVYPDGRINVIRPAGNPNPDNNKPDNAVAFDGIVYSLATTSDTSWNLLKLAQGVQGHIDGPNGWFSPQVWADPKEGRVRIRGLLKVGATLVAQRGTLLGTLPPGRRPAATVPTVVSSHTGPAVYRVDVKPDGDIVLGSTASSASTDNPAGYISMDGISFLIDSKGWVPLTLRPAYTAATDGGFRAPSYRLIEGREVVMSGALALPQQGSADAQVAANNDFVFGVLAESLRPTTATAFPVPAGQGSTSGQHTLRVDASGQMRLIASPGSFVAYLDGVRIPVHGTSLQLGPWQIVSDPKGGLFLQSGEKGYKAFGITKTGELVYKTRKENQASESWSHTGNAPEGHVLTLGTWAFGARDGNHFVINKKTTDREMPQFLARGDGELYVRQDGGNTAGPAGPEWQLSPSASDIVRVGDWIMGPHHDDLDENHFIITRIDAKNPLLLIRSDGAIFGGPQKPVSATTLEQTKFALKGASCAISVATYTGMLAFGTHWTLGANNDAQLLVAQRRASKASLVVHSDGMVAYKQMVPRAPPGWKISAANYDSEKHVRLGKWYIGFRDGGHFVACTQALAEKDLPELLIRNDGNIFTGGRSSTRSAAPATWSLKRGDTNVVRIGTAWLMGINKQGHFVLQSDGAKVPQFVVEATTGTVHMASTTSPVASSCIQRWNPTSCSATENKPAAALLAMPTASPWLVGSRSGDTLTFQPLSESSPALVLNRVVPGSDIGVGPLQGLALVKRLDSVRRASLVHRAADAATGVLDFGFGWLFGPKDKSYFVISKILGGPAVSGAAPQFALSRDGVLSVPTKVSATAAPPEWALDPTQVGATGSQAVVMAVGDWLVGPKDGSHFIICHKDRKARGERPDLLIRQDGVLFVDPVMLPSSSSADSGAACNIEPECDTTVNYLSFRNGIQTCTPLTVCKAGTGTIRKATLRGDRVCRACELGATFTAKAGTTACAPVRTSCTALEEYEVAAPTASSDRECKRCSVCPSTHHQTAKCTATSDTQCQGCTVCDPTVNGFESRPCSDTVNTQCTPCSACETGVTFARSKCTRSRDTECSPVSPPCKADEEEELAAPTATSDRVCAPVLTCAPGSEAIYGDVTRPKRVTDCKPCVAGTTDADGDPSTPCIACNSGHFVPPGATGQCDVFLCAAGTVDNDLSAATPCLSCENGESYMATAGGTGPCSEATLCAPGNEETVAATTTSDRECAPCVDGTYSDTENGLCRPHKNSCGAVGSFTSTPASAVSDAICAPCAAGTTDHDLDASTRCVDCGEGSYCPEGSNGVAVAFKCAVGTTDIDRDAATPCVPCVAGSFAARQGNAGPCRVWRDCRANEKETQAGTNASNRICARTTTTTTAKTTAAAKENNNNDDGSEGERGGDAQAAASGEDGNAATGSNDATGAIVGAVVGVALLVAIIAVVVHRRRSAGGMHSNSSSNEKGPKVTSQTLSFDNPMYTDETGLEDATQYTMAEAGDSVGYQDVVPMPSDTAGYNVNTGNPLANDSYAQPNANDESGYMMVQPNTDDQQGFGFSLEEEEQNGGYFDVQPSEA